jgi:hypothetical protein
VLYLSITPLPMPHFCAAPASRIDPKMSGTRLIAQTRFDHFGFAARSSNEKARIYLFFYKI